MSWSVFSAASVTRVPSVAAVYQPMNSVPSGLVLVSVMSVLRSGKFASAAASP